jgi:tungstate transport system substrate-binding protein
MRKFLLITAISMVTIAIGIIVVSLFTMDNYLEVAVDVPEAVPDEEDEVMTRDVLKIAAATSTVDTGLLEMLSLEFYTDTGITLEYIPVETNEALDFAEGAEVDIVLVQALAGEELLEQEGFGRELLPVMYNDFIVIGPGDMVEMTDVVELLFTLVDVLELPFISRGDSSGAHRMERSVWERQQLDPTENPNYTEVEQGMSATILMANEMKAFTVTDRGTWLKELHAGNVEMELIIMCEGDPLLFNQYGIITVNPEVHPEVNIEEANAFIEWITSDRIQELIGQFGVAEFGEALFVPNAGN